MFVPSGPVHGSPERHGRVQVNRPLAVTAWPAPSYVTPGLFLVSDW